MLTTILLVLKIVGIVLLCIIGLLLLLIMLVLFVPVRYKGNASKDNGEENPIRAFAGVSWLLHILSADLEYDGGKTGLKIRIFGIRLRSAEEREERRRQKREKRRRRKDKENKAENKKTKEKKKDSEPEYTIYEYKDGEEIKTEHRYEKDREDKPEPDTSTWNTVAEYEEGAVNDKTEDISQESIRDKLRKKTEKIPEHIGTAYDRIKNGLERVIQKAGKVFNDIDYYHTALCNDSKNREVIKLLIKKLQRLIRAIRPRKVKGHLDYGSEDPSSTGKVLAAAAVLYPWYGRSIRVNPDFANECLAFELDLKGRIYLCVVAKVALQLYFNRKVKRFIRIMKKENK